jgi:predicted ATPase
VGRERESLEARRVLSMTRLLTLTGAGGSGKTRLAQEVARGLAGAYPDGTWIVEFAPLSDPALMAQAVASVLEGREHAGQPISRTLVSHLASRQMLLILDNCEHVVEEAASLAEELLKQCPGLKVLAKSREPLGVPGETVWTVPPLSIPRGSATPEQLIWSEAVHLFVDRARSRVPGFALTRDNAEAADPRQRTMTATLDWSYRLLEQEERTLLARLSVFAGGMTLEAIEAVCSDAAKRRTLTTLWAVVNADGTLDRDKGVTASNRVDTGDYRVTFNRDVSGCAYSATLGNVQSGEISVFEKISDPNATTPRQIAVATRDSAGILQDRPFQLVVRC